MTRHNQKKTFFIITVLILWCSCSVFSQEAAAGEISSVQEETEASPDRDLEISSHLLPFVFSYDVELALNNMSSENGLLGIGFEIPFFTHFAAGFYFSHDIFYTQQDSLCCNATQFQLTGECYPFTPFKKNLSGFYIYAGVSAGFLFYTDFSSQNLGDEYRGFLLTQYTQTGYKFSLPLGFIIDLGIGYRLAWNSGIKVIGSAEDYLNSGIYISLKLSQAFRLQNMAVVDDYYYPDTVE